MAAVTQWEKVISHVSHANPTRLKDASILRDREQFAGLLNLSNCSAQSVCDFLVGIEDALEQVQFWQSRERLFRQALRQCLALRNLLVSGKQRRLQPL